MRRYRIKYPLSRFLDDQRVSIGTFAEIKEKIEETMPEFVIVCYDRNVTPGGVNDLYSFAEFEHELAGIPRWCVYRDIDTYHNGFIASAIIEVA